MKKLPSGQELIVLSRKYVDEKWNVDESKGDYSFQLQAIVQQDFMKIVYWLKEKGY